MAIEPDFGGPPIWNKKCRTLSDKGGVTGCAGK